jgi:hypothetical protein
MLPIAGVDVLLRQCSTHTLLPFLVGHLVPVEGVVAIVVDGVGGVHAGSIQDRGWLVKGVERGIFFFFFGIFPLDTRSPR